MAKVVLGFIGNKLVVVDKDTSDDSVKECYSEGCDKVLIHEWSDALYKCWTEQTDVDWSLIKE